MIPLYRVRVVHPIKGVSYPLTGVRLAHARDELRQMAVQWINGLYATHVSLKADELRGGLRDGKRDVIATIEQE